MSERGAYDLRDQIAVLRHLGLHVFDFAAEAFQFLKYLRVFHLAVCFLGQAGSHNLAELEIDFLERRRLRIGLAVPKNRLATGRVRIARVDLQIGKRRGLALGGPAQDRVPSDEVLVRRDKAHLPGMDRRGVTRQLVPTRIGLLDAHHVHGHGAERSDVMRLTRLPEHIPQLTQPVVGRVQLPGEGASEREAQGDDGDARNLDLARDHKVSIAPGLIVMTRCLVLMEGVGMRLDPEFNTAEELEPMLRKLVEEQYRPDRVARDLGGQMFDNFATMTEYPEHFGEILRKLSQGRLRVDTHLQGLDRLSKRFESSSNRVVQALIVSSLLVSSSMVMDLPVGPKLWGVSALGLAGYLFAGLIGVRILTSMFRR